MNTYGYVGGNPLNLTDPFGLAEKCKTILKVPFYDIKICEDDGKKDPNKKKGKQKREKKQIKDVCKEYDIGDRNDFGDFLEEWKADNGYTGGDSLPYDTLREVAKEYKGF